jgi:hypothetical protein
MLLNYSFIYTDSEGAKKLTFSRPLGMYVRCDTSLCAMLYPFPYPGTSKQIIQFQILTNTNPGQENQFINLPRSFISFVGAFRKCSGTLGSGPLCSAMHSLAKDSAWSTSRLFGALHKNKSISFL